MWTRWAKVAAVVAVLALGAYWYMAEQREQQEGWDTLHQIGQGACDETHRAASAFASGRVTRQQAYSTVESALSAAGYTREVMRLYDLEYEGSALTSPYDAAREAMDDVAAAIDSREANALARAQDRLAAACSDALEQVEGAAPRTPTPGGQRSPPHLRTPTACPNRGSGLTVGALVYRH